MKHLTFAMAVAVTALSITMAAGACRAGEATADCVTAGESVAADDTYTYLYHSRPCLDASGRQKTTYYKTKIIAGLSTEKIPVTLPEDFSGNLLLDDFDDNHAYAIGATGKLTFFDFRDGSTGEIGLTDNGASLDYRVTMKLGRGDHGAYYSVQIDGAERVIHVDSQHVARLIQIPDRSLLRLADNYDMPGLWVDTDDSRHVIRRIVRAIDGVALMDQAYFEHHGQVTSHDVHDIWPQASMDGKTVILMGDLNLGPPAASDSARQDSLVVLKDDGREIQHTGPSNTYVSSYVHLAPSGTYYVSSEGAYVAVYDVVSNKRVVKKRPTEYVRYLAKGPLGLYYKSDRRVSYVDADGLAFDMDLF